MLTEEKTAVSIWSTKVEMVLGHSTGPLPKQSEGGETLYQKGSRVFDIGVIHNAGLKGKIWWLVKQKDD